MRITRMICIERELDGYLTLLRKKIRDRGFTQLEVQEALGWGRSYISQLLTKQKTLRLEQVLLILNVIGVDPGTFFRELYNQQRPTEGSMGTLSAQDVQRLQMLVQGLIDVLLRKGVITRAGLSETQQRIDESKA